MGVVSDLSIKKIYFTVPMETSVFQSPFFHQFMVASLLGLLLAQISIGLVQAPRWLVSMLSQN